MPTFRSTTGEGSDSSASWWTAGYYSEEFIRAGFALHDKNGNGYWCYKLAPDDRFFPLVNFFGNDDLENRGPR